MQFKRALIVSLLLGASKATTAAPLLSLPSISILTLISFYVLLRSFFILVFSKFTSLVKLVRFFFLSVCFMLDDVPQVFVDQDPGLTGNLLVERLVGAHIELISKEEYAKIGSVVRLLPTLSFIELIQSGLH